MTTKHSATHLGLTFTRNSKGRVYSHAVIAAGSVAADRLQAEESARFSWKQNLRYFTELASGVDKLADQYPDQVKDAERAKRQADAKVWLAGGVERCIADHLAHFDARAAKMATQPDGDTYFYLLGWCSRPDLAVRLAASRPRTVILAAVVA